MNTSNNVYVGNKRRLNDGERHETPAPAGLVEQRRNRTTGGLVSLYNAEAQGLDPNGGQWVTVCEKHSVILSHETQKLARSHMADVLSWCEQCRAEHEPAPTGQWAKFDFLLERMIAEAATHTGVLPATLVELTKLVTVEHIADLAAVLGSPDTYAEAEVCALALLGGIDDPRARAIVLANRINEQRLDVVPPSDYPAGSMAVDTDSRFGFRASEFDLSALKIIQGLTGMSQTDAVRFSLTLAAVLLATEDNLGVFKK